MTAQLWARQPVTALGKVMLGALLGSFIGLGAWQLWSGMMSLPITIIMACEAGAMALLSIGWVWAPLVGAVMGSAALIAGVGTQVDVRSHLARPGDFAPFTILTLIVVCGVSALGAGIAATLALARGDRAAPRWLPLARTAIGGLLCGVVITSALASAVPPPAPTATTTPTVQLTSGNFVPTAIIVPKGDKLHLVEMTKVEHIHILQNGAWQGGQPRPASEPGAPMIDSVYISHGSVDLGPFTASGTFHIFCRVHYGMNLTVFVP
jgi:hypothetical protein